MTLRDHGLGALLQPDGALGFRVFSAHATRVELCIFRNPKGEPEIRRIALTREPGDLWSTELAPEDRVELGLGSVVYYGYRAFGPNWTHDPAWVPGSTLGFVTDVDREGNRFNPNKVLIDPYTTELSHDPGVARTYADPNACEDAYFGGEFRTVDTGPIAPKSLAFLAAEPVTPRDSRLERALRDEIIYEVHLRGFTMQDESLPESERGTYRGAGKKAAYLKGLGVTAVEFLPVQEFADEQNDDGDPRGDNYWGYMTLGFFAPNRRYAANRSPGGPTREFKEMVEAFHAEGIKVYLDVVYNHTGEGILRRAVESVAPANQSDVESAIRDAARSRSDDSLQDPRSACLLSLAGLDNASYYRLREEGTRYHSFGACGGNLNYEAPVVVQLILDSLDYWANVMGVDGFRFDLAPVLGTVLRDGALKFDGRSPLLRAIAAELPARGGGLRGVDLIAEPWGGPACQLGDFSPEWAVWNSYFRDTLKTAENKYLEAQPLPVSRIATAVSGSSEAIQKTPWNAINYVASHDDCNALRNLMSYDSFFHLNEAQERWDQISWGHQGDEERQRKAVRNAFTLLMFSAGVPMFAGGDELLRWLPQYRNGVGRMNLVGVDAPEAYLDWTAYRQWWLAGQAGDAAAQQALVWEHPELQMYLFVSRLTRFRHEQPCLRRATYFTGQVNGTSGLKDIAWYDRYGRELTGTQWDEQDYLGYRIDADPPGGSGSTTAIFVAYNRSPRALELTLPACLPGHHHYRLLDTDNTDGWMTEHCNFDGGATLLVGTYTLHERSILVALEKPSTPA